MKVQKDNVVLEITLEQLGNYKKQGYTVLGEKPKKAITSNDYQKVVEEKEKLNAEITEKDKKIEKLTNEVAEKDKKIEELSNLLDETKKTNTSKPNNK